MGKTDRNGYKEEPRPRRPTTITPNNGGGERSEGSCSYTCNGWPYSSCRTVYQGRDGSARGTCISPFSRNSNYMYSNYPQCALNSKLRKCSRCDDYCSQQDGKQDRNGYRRNWG